MSGPELGEWYTDSPRSSHDRSWILTSRSATRISVLVAVMTAAAAAVMAVLIVLLVIWQEPISGGGPALIAAGVICAIGQVWAVQIVVARRGPRTGRPRAGFREAWQRSGALPEYWLRGLSPTVARITYALFVAGWLAAMTATPQLFHGVPGGSGLPGCVYVLVNHGHVACVSKDVYELAGAALDRFFAGILLGFFALQAGVSLGQAVMGCRSR